MDNLDMVKSLVGTIESLVEENKELREEIKSLKECLSMRYNQQELPPVTDNLPTFD